MTDKATARPTKPGLYFHKIADHSVPSIVRVTDMAAPTEPYDDDGNVIEWKPDLWARYPGFPKSFCPLAEFPVERLDTCEPYFTHTEPITPDAVNNYDALLVHAKAMAIINELRADEPNYVGILCPNPEGEGPDNEAVEVCADWTDYKDRRFYGSTLLEALEAALTGKEAFGIEISHDHH